MYISVTIAKSNDHAANEDACLCAQGVLAVSDGAGGCGLFANEWSQHLIANLPQSKPIATFPELDNWVDGIWEAFYNAHELKAKEGDGMLLSKFYNEGSCATIAAAWRVAPDKWRWMAYGDSVVFHYNCHLDLLEHSFTRLADFSNPPRLVSCKDPLEKEGFRSGEFRIDDASVVFAASDALSHYIIMMYELSKSSEYVAELEEERQKPTYNAELLKSAALPLAGFWKGVLQPLLHAATAADTFQALIKDLCQQNVLDVDDCTLVAACFQASNPSSVC